MLTVYEFGRISTLAAATLHHRELPTLREFERPVF